MFMPDEQWSPPIEQRRNRQHTLADKLRYLALGALPGVGALGGGLIGGQTGSTLGKGAGSLLGAILEELRPRKTEGELYYQGRPLSQQPNLRLRPEASAYYQRLQQQPQEEGIYGQAPLEEIAGSLGNITKDMLMDYLLKKEQPEGNKTINTSPSTPSDTTQPESPDADKQKLVDEIIRLILSKQYGLR